MNEQTKLINISFVSGKRLEIPFNYESITDFDSVKNALIDGMDNGLTYKLTLKRSFTEIFIDLSKVEFIEITATNNEKH